MIKTTMKLMNQLNKKGLEFNSKTGRFSPKNEYMGGKIKCYNYGEKGHIAPKCSKPKKNQDRAKSKGKAVAAPPNLIRLKCGNQSPEGLESSRTSKGLK